MTMAYNFIITLSTPKGHKIEIDPQADYGYWEWPDGSEGGGLWFADKELMDMDGHWELPKPYVELLRTNGYILDDSWD